MSEEDVKIVTSNYPFRERCFQLGALFTGATGSAILGYLTQVFERKDPTPQLTLSLRAEDMNRYPWLKQFHNMKIGGHYGWRIGLSIALPTLLYSLLECRSQSDWPRRRATDSFLAGAITGGLLGLRGIPGGALGAAYGAGGFAAYALLLHATLRKL